MHQFHGQRRRRKIYSRSKEYINSNSHEITEINKEFDEIDSDVLKIDKKIIKLKLEQIELKIKKIRKKLQSVPLKQSYYIETSYVFLSLDEFTEFTEFSEMCYMTYVFNLSEHLYEILNKEIQTKISENIANYCDKKRLYYYEQKEKLSQEERNLETFHQHPEDPTPVLTRIINNTEALEKFNELVINMKYYGIKVICKNTLQK
jgi:glucan-binding YG repeat protein